MCFTSFSSNQGESDIKVSSFKRHGMSFLPLYVCVCGGGVSIKTKQTPESRGIVGVAVSVADENPSIYLTFTDNFNL